MNNYLIGVMDRLSIGGLVALLVLFLVCLVIASVRSKVSKKSIQIVNDVCEHCGRGGDK